jgi:hypothetical protein
MTLNELTKWALKDMIEVRIRLYLEEIRADIDAFRDGKISKEIFVGSLNKRSTQYGQEVAEMDAAVRELEKK